MQLIWTTRGSKMAVENSPAEAASTDVTASRQSHCASISASEATLPAWLVGQGRYLNEVASFVLLFGGMQAWWPHKTGPEDDPVFRKLELEAAVNVTKAVGRGKKKKQLQ